jgi:hypothetical protein
MDPFPDQTPSRHPSPTSSFLSQHLPLLVSDPSSQVLQPDGSRVSGIEKDQNLDGPEFPEAGALLYQIRQFRPLRHPSSSESSPSLRWHVVSAPSSRPFK